MEWRQCRPPTQNRNKHVVTGISVASQEHLLVPIIYSIDFICTALKENDNYLEQGNK